MELCKSHCYLNGIQIKRREKLKKETREASKTIQKLKPSKEKKLDYSLPMLLAMIIMII